MVTYFQISKSTGQYSESQVEQSMKFSKYTGKVYLGGFSSKKLETQIQLTLIKSPIHPQTAIIKKIRNLKLSTSC